MVVTARQIQEACGDIPFIFRAGVWKPRTRPGTFHGAGAEGLSWLQEVQASGIPVATEVATAEHVRLATAAGIDYLWIGARTSANPIAVETIAEGCSKTKGIFIKNPVNADAGLWLGNIERLEKTGVPVAVIHRGCNHQPCWAMAHKVRQERPDIPMLLDPSHLSGKAESVPELMKKIPELGLDGAMVEVHYRPECALSDAKQQIKPSDLAEFIGVYRSVAECIRKDIELNWLRAEIDELDEQLWETIAARMDVSRRIGEWKKAQGIAPLQPERYKEIVERLKTPPSPLCKGEKGLRTEFKLALWEMIHEESLRQQE